MHLSLILIKLCAERFNLQSIILKTRKQKRLGGPVKLWMEINSII